MTLMKSVKLVPQTWVCLLFAAVICLLFVPQPGPARDLQAQGTEIITLNEWLTLRGGGGGPGGRGAAPADPVAAEIISGKWKAPKEGDTVTMPNGDKRTWTKVTAGAQEGPGGGRGFGGAYSCFSLQSDKEKVVLLVAPGCSMVYVNGEPRTGDVYGYGNMPIPVLLKKGKNDLLFSGGRGGLKVQVLTPRADAVLVASEQTTPDLIIGENGEYSAAVLVVNASSRPLPAARILARPAEDAPELIVKGFESPTTSSLPSIPPLSIRKVPYQIKALALNAPGKVKMQLDLELMPLGTWVPTDSDTIEFEIVRPDQPHKRTFTSGIDGALQYYAVQPAHPLGIETERPALVLSVHGAGVEAIGQARAYSPKSWAHIVAPTNRRPYGYDWEDWGRMDAMEVLALAKKQYDTAAYRTYLTGHSMGGHGAWHLGVTYPDQWGAIAPSAGWASFGSYGGSRGREGGQAAPSPVEAMLRRAASPGDTLSSLSLNYRQHGVYILHGEADDNVPVTQARMMRKLLTPFHSDLTYHEEPGQGHWWDLSPEPGADCVDWAPMFDFFARHRVPSSDSIRRVQFYTACPSVSSKSHWVTIEAQIEDLKLSSVDIQYDPGRNLFFGATKNVARLSLDLSYLPEGKRLDVDLDGVKIERLGVPKEKRLWFERRLGSWYVLYEKPSADLKGSHRYGPFKDAFRNKFQFVYGTKGSTEENAAAFQKARHDGELFMYRGNGSVDVVADADFDPKSEPDRNVILYGNADTNAAWAALLGDSPVQVRRGMVRIGGKEARGKDLACIFLRPRPGSDVASVGVVGGSGPAGMRLTQRLQYLSPASGYPDCLVVGPEMLTKGMAEGVRAAGFFGQDWSVASGDFVWQNVQEVPRKEKSVKLTAEQQRAFRLPKGYLAYRAAGPIQIDGVLDDAEWGKIPWGDYHEDIEGDKKPLPTYKVREKMQWDDENLYIAAELEEPHVWGTLTKRQSVIFYDNDFEMFIDPDSDRRFYVEYEMNALNTIWTMLLERTYNEGVDARVHEYPGIRTGVHVNGSPNDPRDKDKGWTLEIAFPWKALSAPTQKPCPPREGDQWRLNFSRVEWDVDLVDGMYVKVPRHPEHNWIWSPQGFVNMHLPEYWGYVQFSAQKAGEAGEDLTAGARQVLRHVHFAQMEFHRKHKRFATDLAELGVAGIGHQTISGPIRIEGHVDDFKAAAEVRVRGAGKQTISIGRDARFVIRKD
jgi:pimeloyl-ACP methyl ester carboxylesterase